LQIFNIIYAVFLYLNRPPPSIRDKDSVTKKSAVQIA